MQSKITLQGVKGMIHRSFLSLCLLCLFTGVLNAQTLVNGNLSTGATSSNGTAAPAGTTWSEVQSGNVNGGYSASIPLTFKLADNFVIPAGQNWNLTTMTFYGYQTGYAGTVSPFTTIRVTIHSGTVTGPVVFGDQTTNRFSSSSFSNMYRIFNGAPATDRKIWAINAATNVSLGAGTYWVEYATDITGGGAHFIPASTVVGTVTQPGNDAQQWNAGWGPLLDGTNQQDLPFSVNYTTTCTDATAPVISTSAISSCAGAPVTLTVTGGSLNNAPNWEWYTGSCGGTVVGTGNSIVVNPNATTTYYARGVGGCTTAGPCGQITINVTPCTCLTPDVATICQGTIQRLSVSGTGVPGTATVSSGPIVVPVPDANAAGVTSTLAVSLPAGASITTMSVTLNLTHTWDSDMRFNLVGPNGQVINLIAARGGSGDNFVNTVITSAAGAPSLATGTAPFTGTYAADGTNGEGPTGFVSNAGTNWSLVTAQPSGNWILAMRDVAGGDLGTLTSWSLNINYVILPTATWTGGTIFTNPAATTPYVAGTQVNFIYVQPSATTTYTANIASGPCAGNNDVTVNVLLNPVLSISPSTACGPVNLTASGAATYLWTPSAGLSATTGATVNANPSSTTTYTVTGTGANSCKSTAQATVNSAPTASVIAPVAGATYQIQEGFTTAPPSGWTVTNNSNPVGATSWFQGNTTVFAAFNGAATSYAGANWQNTTATGAGDISTWLITPVVNIKNGDQVSFYTRTTDGTFPDRLELRLSTAGNSTNVGATSTSVGDFTTLLLSVNPNLQTGTAYPSTWTRFTATISGITGTVQGRVGLRYFVTNGGGAGSNSDFIGVDQFEYSTPSSVNCANVVTNMAVTITGGVGPYSLVYSNGTTNTTLNGYTSGSNIQVSPATTTTYSIVSVTGANGCVGTGNSGSATITITPPAAVTTQPTNKSICEGSNTTFAAVTTPAVGNSFQWQVSIDNGATYTNIVNGAPYSGATTGTLTVTAATSAMSGNRYRVRVQGSCGALVTSTAATLTVTTAAVITTQPVVTTVCGNGSTSSSTTFSVAATGASLTYVWQVSTDNGTTWTTVSNGANYSGATSNTLTLNNVPVTFQGNLYRALVSSGSCTATTSSSAALTNVYEAPVIVVSANPYTSLTPGMTTTLSAAVSPTAVTSYQWFLDGVLIPGANSSTYVVDVDGLGDYTVAVVNANGCGRTSSSVTISDSTSGIVFIYPSPNTGRFQVRYFAGPGTVSPRMLNVFDAKGARVYSRSYTIGAPYERMDVDLRFHGKGIYMVELTDRNGKRIKAGRVIVL